MDNKVIQIFCLVDDSPEILDARVHLMGSHLNFIFIPLVLP